MHMHTARGKRAQQPTPHTCWYLRWWVAREHLRVVGCYLWEPHTLSPESTWQSVRVAGSNTPVTLVSLHVTIHGVDKSYQLRVFLYFRSSCIDGPAGCSGRWSYRRCLCSNSLLRELDHATSMCLIMKCIHMNTLECSFVVHNQL